MTSFMERKVKITSAAVMGTIPFEAGRGMILLTAISRLALKNFMVMVGTTRFGGASLMMSSKAVVAQINFLDMEAQTY